MYSLMNAIFSDKNGGEIFTCFGLWHLCYIAVAVVIMLIIFAYLRNKGSEVRQKFISWIINTAFGLYIADFFLMPFAYEEIDIEKLPFHICTAMCVMCFLSRHTKFFAKFRLQFAVLGMISNLVYLTYPAGVMWYGTHPLSYRVVQTLMFHGIMAVYGLTVLVFDDYEFEWKKCYKDFAVISAMTLWAFLGNTLYNGQSGSYSNNFNWFFLVQDPFNILPKNVAPYVMPVLNIAAFFTVDMLVYGVCYVIRKHQCNKK